MIAKCQNAGCKKKVAPGMRKYCSARCRRAADRISHRRASKKANAEMKGFHENAYIDVAPRKCLGCGKTFKSQGNWNRICGRCSGAEHGGFVRSVRMGTIDGDKGGGL